MATAAFTTPATVIDLAFSTTSELENYPGQNPQADWYEFSDYRRVALLRLFPDPAAASGFGVAIVFRRKVRGFVAPDGSRTGWKPDFVIVPASESCWRICHSLVQPQPLFQIEEELLALSMFRSLAMSNFDMLPDVWKKWSEVHVGNPSNAARLDTPLGWKPQTPTSWRKQHYADHPQSLCSRWMERNPTANLPPKLARERGIVRA